MLLINSLTSFLLAPLSINPPVQVIAGFKPVTANKEGSYLTMWSLNGLVFGIINVIGNFGTVFVDQSYWQGAIGGGQAMRASLCAWLIHWLIHCMLLPVACHGGHGEPQQPLPTNMNLSRASEEDECVGHKTFLC
jgi:Na+/proline symporter